MRKTCAKLVNAVLIACAVCLFVITASAQNPLGQKQFFTDTALLKVTLETDLNNLTSGRIGNDTQEGTFTFNLSDTSSVTGKIVLNARGHMRRQTCYLPPLKIHFAADTTAGFAKLRSLKMVTPCDFLSNYEQLLIKEYLVYKIYNLLTDLSFKARLVAIEIKDEKGKKKPVNTYAFFLEDIEQLAKRNGMTALADEEKVATEATDREHMALVAIFQYMIGNTDWSVPAQHNIKLVRLKDNPNAKPFVVAYDFDYGGIVDAPYATPDPLLSIQNVTERLYRGFARTMEELTPVIKKFKDNKSGIYSIITNCRQLAPVHKKVMTRYLDDFFKILDKPKAIKDEFIDKARVEGGI
jgi:hypothetical protein